MTITENKELIYAGPTGPEKITTTTAGTTGIYYANPLLGGNREILGGEFIGWLGSQGITGGGGIQYQSINTWNPANPTNWAQTMAINPTRPRPDKNIFIRSQKMVNLDFAGPIPVSNNDLLFPELVMDCSDSMFNVVIGTDTRNEDTNYGGSGSLSIWKNDSTGLSEGTNEPNPNIKNKPGVPACQKFGIMKDNLRLYSKTNIADGIGATGPRASIYFSAENDTGAPVALLGQGAIVLEPSNNIITGGASAGGPSVLLNTD